MSDAEKPLEERVASLERDLAALRERTDAHDARLAASTNDAEAARVLAAGADRDVSEVRAELRAHSQVLNALRQDHVELRQVVQGGFAAMAQGFAEMDRRFTEMDRGFTEMDRGFAEIRGVLDGTVAGQENLATMLATLIDREGNPPGD